MHLTHRRFRVMLPIVLGAVLTAVPLAASPLSGGDLFLGSTPLPVAFYTPLFSGIDGAYVIPSLLPASLAADGQKVDRADTVDQAAGARLLSALANSLGVAPGKAEPETQADNGVELGAISELSVTGIQSNSALLLLGTGLALIWAGRRLR